MTTPISTDPRGVREKYRSVPTPASSSSAESLTPDLPPAADHRAAWAPEPARTVVSAPSSSAESDRTAVISGRTEAAKRGWRAKLNQVLGLHLSKSEDEQKYDKRVAQIQRTLRVPKRVSVLSGKGAAGKTSIALNLGATIATHQRGAKVAAISIDPLGNISDRVRPVNGQPPRSVMSLAADDNLRRASDVSSYLQTDKSGLRVLGASSADGAGFLTPEALDRSLDVLSEHYDVTVVDFGLNIDSSVYHRALTRSDQLVLAAATTADSINELHTLIKTLRAFGGKYVELINGAVVVFTQTRPGKSHIDVDAERDRIVNAYGTPVVTIPFDEHIAEGGPMSLELVEEDTRLPYVWLAAEVMTKLPVD